MNDVTPRCIAVYQDFLEHSECLGPERLFFARWTRDHAPVSKVDILLDPLNKFFQLHKVTHVFHLVKADFQKKTAKMYKSFIRQIPPAVNVITPWSIRPGERGLIIGVPAGKPAAH